MSARLRSKLSFANVVASIALFVALGGGAYAASKVNSSEVANNTLKSVDLKNNKGVKGADVAANTLTGSDIDEGSLSGVDQCPSTAASRVGDVCYGGSQTTDWDAAERDCAAKGLRLPSIAESLLVVGAAGGSTWTDEVLDAANRVLIKSDEPKIVALGENTNQPYRCVAHPTG
jgi:hypothetical protein